MGKRRGFQIDFHDLSARRARQWYQTGGRVDNGGCTDDQEDVTSGDGALRRRPNLGSRFSPNQTTPGRAKPPHGQSGGMARTAISRSIRAAHGAAEEPDAAVNSKTFLLPAR